MEYQLERTFFKFPVSAGINTRYFVTSEVKLICTGLEGGGFEISGLGGKWGNRQGLPGAADRRRFRMHGRTDFEKVQSLCNAGRSCRILFRKS